MLDIDSISCTERQKKWLNIYFWYCPTSAKQFVVYWLFCPSWQQTNGENIVACDNHRCISVSFLFPQHDNIKKSWKVERFIEYIEKYWPLKPKCSFKIFNLHGKTESRSYKRKASKEPPSNIHTHCHCYILLKKKKRQSIEHQFGAVKEHEQSLPTDAVCLS